jgi:flagellar assembly protein FliH
MMSTYTQIIQWPAGSVASEVVLAGAESHWDSIQKHFESERMQGYERGRREAALEVRQKLEDEHRDTALKVQTLIRSFEDAIPAAFQEMEQALSHMACAMTRKLVADVPIDAERMRAVVSQAVLELSKDADLQIRMHPADMELLQSESGGDLSTMFAHEGKIEFVPDARLTRGGCYIKTPFGDFDATLESKWDQIESLFRNQTEHSRHFSISSSKDKQTEPSK